MTLKRIEIETEEVVAVTQTKSLSINAAFFQEIKEHDKQFRELLDQAIEMLSSPHLMTATPKSLSDLLEKLQDEIGFRFSLEEAYGYFNGALDVEPRLSDNADTLRSQHRTLFVEICDIVECSLQLLHGEAPRRVLRKIATDFDTFCYRLLDHEDRENDLILQVYFDDMGVGD